MSSRDYLIRQFEEMGFFLASLLRRVLKMKEENQQQQIESAVREELFQELKLDIDQAIILENEDFAELVKIHFTTDDQLDKFADILKMLGQEIEFSFTLNKANYLRKALYLYQNLQENSSVFSYDRRIKILEIQEILLRTGLDKE
ncbi:MAG: hypothetical protein JNK09_08925 [Prolixibacteraceae bacterium]|nr:hypothetical protein [Prolixibacteraceae bacterium]